MKKTYFLLAFLTAAVIAPFVALPATAETTSQITTRIIQLTKSGSYLRAAGSQPVIIKDKARITKSLDLRGPLFNKKGNIRINDTVVPKLGATFNLGSTDFYWANAYVGNIILPDGGTVDGVDVSALAETVAGLSSSTSESLPTDCADEQVIKFDGEGWECADDATSSEGTSYTAGAGLALDGTTFSLEGTSYDNVIIVAKSGGDFTTIDAAMDSIVDSSSSNKYYVWVAPGVYVEEVDMPDYVTLEGAGPERVLIGSLSTTNTVGAITAGVDSEIRNLSVAGYGATYSIGIYIAPDASAEIENVHMSVGDPTGTAYGVYNAGAVVLQNVDLLIGDAPTAGYGVYTTSTAEIYGSKIQVADATISHAVYVDGSSSTPQVTIRDSQVIVSGDDSTVSTVCSAYYQTGASSNVSIYGSTLDATRTDEAEGCSSTNAGAIIASGSLEIYDSQVKGHGFGAFQADNTLTVINSQLAGGNEHSGNTITCVGAYDGAFAALNASCS